MSYGKVTVGFGSPEQHDIEVQDFTKALFKGDRYVHVAKLVDGSYCITVENLASSGRAPHQSIRLGEESFAAMMCTCAMYMQVKGMDVEKLMRDLQNGENIHYNVSDNLQPLKP
jgi:hypothetical protein